MENTLACFKHKLFTWLQNSLQQQGSFTVTALIYRYITTVHSLTNEEENDVFQTEFFFCCTFWHD